MRIDELRNKRRDLRRDMAAIERTLQSWELEQVRLGRAFFLREHGRIVISPRPSKLNPPPDIDTLYDLHWELAQEEFCLPGDDVIADLEAEREFAGAVEAREKNEETEK